MGKCPNCGQSTFLNRQLRCKICRIEICKKCGIYLFTGIEDTSNGMPNIQGIVEWNVCSHKCFQDFADKLEKCLLPKDVGLDLNLSINNLPLLLLEKLPELESEGQFGDKGLKVNRTNVVFKSSGKEEANLLWQRLVRHITLMVIENLKTTKNFEQAARYYEWLGLYKEAGETREINRMIGIKKTNINVDLNTLLKQVAAGGIVAVYRCPHCGAKLKVGKETTAASLRICEHCSSEIETMDMADFLKTALS